MSYPLNIIEIDEQGRRIVGDPESISGTSPRWRKDIERFGPWRLENEYLPASKRCQRIWVSDGPAMETRIIISGECGSCMDVAWRYIESGSFSPWDAVLAVSQTAGRGRHGRKWISPPGNLHGAWLWPAADEKKIAPGWKAMISLLAGYVAAKSLHDLSGIDVRLKWPNDLLAGNRKIGGILTEIRSDHILVGIGINIDACPPDADLRHDSAVPATHLEREGFNTTPLSLWMALAEKGKIVFDQLIAAISPSEFISVFRPMLAWIGRPVRVAAGSEDFVGVISGVSPDGGLCLNREGRDIIIYSGSIILIDG